MTMYQNRCMLIIKEHDVFKRSRKSRICTSVMLRGRGEGQMSEFIQILKKCKEDILYYECTIYGGLCSLRERTLLSGGNT
jgi:hypothetical protein